MEYKIGDKFFNINKRTGEMSETKIVDIKYVFDMRIDGKTNAFTSEEIQDMIESGKIMRTKEEYNQMRIKQLEKELGITLKEVK